MSTQVICWWHGEQIDCCGPSTSSSMIIKQSLQIVQPFQAAFNCQATAHRVQRQMYLNRPCPRNLKRTYIDTYLTQRHIKGFQNIKLVSIYSNSVNRENSKCLHFVSVQMKNIVQHRPFFLSFQTERKNESYLTHWHTKGFQNTKFFSIYSKSVRHKDSKCLHFASVQMKHIVQNRPLKAYGMPLYQISLIFSFCLE